MIWILIVYIGNGEAKTMASVEFSSREKCITAGKAVNDNLSGTFYSTKWTCVEK